MATTTIPLMMRAGTVSSNPTRARWATVSIETEPGHTYVGRIYVPETRKRVSDVLGDDRPFLFVTEVSVDQGETVEPFLAINKRFVKTVRVLHDGAPEAIPRRVR
jgi:hypothetical protein